MTIKKKEGLQFQASRENLLKEIDKVALLASAGKLKRLLHDPIKYLLAISWKVIFYPMVKIPYPVTANAFWGDKINLLLPAATDIYLLGGKSHSSEIALAKFLVLNLHEGDSFVDIGAHYGYFSLLAQFLVKENGRVFAFEPAPTSYKVLQTNLSELSNSFVFNLAASDENENLDFYIFSNLHSEYNTFSPEQFKDEGWYKNDEARMVQLKGVNLTEFFKEKGISPDILKIDVEGAEDKVIQGLEVFLQNNSPIIVMEYLSAKRGNESHRKAAAILFNANYKTYQIKADGKIEKISTSVEGHLDKLKSDSENIVFLKAEGFSGELV